MDQALERVRHWSAERQQVAAELVLALDAMGDEPVEVDAETLAALDKQKVGSVEIPQAAFIAALKMED